MPGSEVFYPWSCLDIFREHRGPSLSKTCGDSVLLLPTAAIHTLIIRSVEGNATCMPLIHPSVNIDMAWKPFLNIRNTLVPSQVESFIFTIGRGVLIKRGAVETHLLTQAETSRALGPSRCLASLWPMETHKVAFTCLLRTVMEAELSSTLAIPSDIVTFEAPATTLQPLAAPKSLLEMMGHSSLPWLSSPSQPGSLT